MPHRRPTSFFNSKYLFYFIFIIYLLILFSEMGLCIASCSYIYYIYIYIYNSQDGGAVGFVDFSKLSFALSSLVQPFDQMGSIPKYVFVILSQRKAYAGRFQKEIARKRTGLITKWPLRRLLFTQLEIVFITISPFTKRTKVVPNVFQKGECYLQRSINFACRLQLQMLPRLIGHLINILVWFCT